MTEQVTLKLSGAVAEAYRAGILHGRAEGLAQAARAIRLGADKFEEQAPDPAKLSKAKRKAVQLQLEGVKAVADGIRGWADELDRQSQASRASAAGKLAELANGQESNASSAGASAGRLISQATDWVRAGLSR
jgi:hypothetical protein